MSTGNVEIEGLGDLFKRVDLLGPNLASCVRTAQWQLGGKMLSQGKKNCTALFEHPTGRLAGSITMAANFTSKKVGLRSPATEEDTINTPPAGDTQQVVVGTNVIYARYQEFGFHGRRELERGGCMVNYSGKPYLYPAFFAHENDFEETLERVIYRKKALENFNQRLPIFDPAGAED